MMFANPSAAGAKVGRQRALLALLAALFGLPACPGSAVVKNPPTDGSGGLVASTRKEALPDPPCERPELWLALYPRDEIHLHYCRACVGSACAEHGYVEGGVEMPWGLLGEENDLPFACNELEYVALAIPAYHGMPIKDPFWKPYFEAQPWYRPDPGFRADRLPQGVAENLRWAEGLARTCRQKEVDRVSESDWQLVIDWFAKKESGQPPLPEKLFVDGKPATEEEFLAFLNSEGLYDFDRRTPVKYMESFVTKGIFPGKKTRTIAVYTGSPGVSCVGYGENCEGFEWIELTVDEAGTILALHVSAAG